MEDSKICLGCNEPWPNDEEFYKPGRDICHACFSEGLRITKPKKPKTRGFRTPEQKRQHQREKYLRHREAYMARMRRWYAANKDVHNAKRRAKRLALKQMEGANNGLNV